MTDKGKSRETTNVTEGHQQAMRPVSMDSVAPTREMIEEWLIDRIARHIHVDSNHIDARTNLTRYDLDSMDVISIVGELEEWLGRPLSPTLFYENSSIRAVTEELVPKV